MLELKMHEAKMMREQGTKIRDIAEAIGKSERTVHYYLSQETRPRKKRIYGSKLDAFKPFVDTILEEDPTYNRVVLYERLKKNKYEGGVSILRDYAAKKSSEVLQKAVIRFETEPAFQAQVDWKLLNTQIVDGKEQKLYAFVMVFGYSRAPFVLHTTSMDQATFLACHVLAFFYFGGVPKEILYDNMKTAFVYEASEGRWIPNRHLLSLARHYGFTPRRCQVRRPQTKGKVERFIDYYARNFWIQVKNTPLLLDALNETVLQWIEKINGKPIRGLDESRKERFDHEKQFITPLPAVPFDWRSLREVKVSRESLICFQSNWYSVPPVYIGKTLRLYFDPLCMIAEVLSDEKIIRRFNVDTEKRNLRLFRDEDAKELKALWLKQRYPGKKKCTRVEPDVSIRSPLHYEAIFSSQEAAS